jgi:hypothetical protein
VEVRDGLALRVIVGEPVDVLEDEILGVEVRVADILLVEVVDPVVVRVRTEVLVSRGLVVDVLEKGVDRVAVFVDVAVEELRIERVEMKLG